MIIDLNQLSQIRQEHNNQTIIFAGGVFDLMHPGHLDLFERMKAEADISIIAVTSDSRVKQRKGNLRPIHDEKTRQQVVGSVRSVDYCLIAPEPDSKDIPTVQILRLLKPNYFMTCDKSWSKHQKIFDDLGAKLLIVPRFSDEVSTILTIEKIQKMGRESRIRRMLLKNYHPNKKLPLKQS